MYSSDIFIHFITVIMYNNLRGINMQLKEIIRDYKYRHNLSNNDLASLFQVSSNTVARWLRGEIKSIQDDTAYRISEVLGYDVLKLMQGDILELSKPILGYVKAGYDLYLAENILGQELVSLKYFNKGDYFLQVKGDSMLNDGIIEGSLVLIQQTSQVNNGDIALVQIDEEVTIKRLFYQEHGILLKASNPLYPERYYSDLEVNELSVQVLGKVIYTTTYY